MLWDEFSNVSTQSGVLANRDNKLIFDLVKMSGLLTGKKIEDTFCDFTLRSKRERSQAITQIDIPDSQKTVLEEIQKFSVLQTAPLAALQKISEWQEQLKN